MQNPTDPQIAQDAVESVGASQLGEMRRANQKPLEQLNDLLSPTAKEVDKFLSDALEEISGPLALVGMIRYHLGFGTSLFKSLAPEDPIRRGRRLRSTFSVLIARSFRANEEAVRALAVAAEYMHSASLVHDDIQDRDLLRWGRSTVWSEFGIDHAINVGDALIAMTFRTLSGLRKLPIPAERVLAAIAAYSNTCFEMSEGQCLDLSQVDDHERCSENYTHMVAGKTASAFSNVCYVSAVVGGASLNVAEAYARFGRAFGLMYQICDDVNSIYQSLEATGKNPFQDIQLRKLTLPVVMALERNGSLLQHYFDVKETANNGSIAAILDKVRSQDVYERCRAEVSKYRNEAMHALNSINIASHCNLCLCCITSYICAAMDITSEEFAAQNSC